jgi:hypothetical protein
MPEIRGAMRAVFNPLGRSDRCTALGARIPAGQIADVYFGHDASPLLFAVENEWDSFTAGFVCAALSPAILAAPLLMRQ